MTHYHAGSNVSGYLPMSDDTGYPYETFSDAMSSLEDDLTRAWDSDYSASGEVINKTYSEAREEMRNASAPAFLTYTPTNFDSEHDIPTAWWVTPCDETDCAPHCEDERHGTPCPLPCDACADECGQ